MSPGRRGGPEPKPETAQDEVAAAVLTIVPSVTDTSQASGPHRTTLVVHFESDEGHHTRRPYRSLAAAERAVRAAARRGVSARLVLCDLVEIREITVESEAVSR